MSKPARRERGVGSKRSARCQARARVKAPFKTGKNSVSAVIASYCPNKSSANSHGGGRSAAQTDSI